METIEHSDICYRYILSFSQIDDTDIEFISNILCGYEFERVKIDKYDFNSNLNFYNLVDFKSYISANIISDFLTNIAYYCTDNWIRFFFSITPVFEGDNIENE